MAPSISPNIDREQQYEKLPQLDQDVISASVISKVKRLLWYETGEGFGNVLGNIRSSWYGVEGVFYTREEERLKKYLPPFQYGLASSVFLFLNFRAISNPIFQRWRKIVLQRIRTSSSINNTTSLSASQQHQQQQHGIGYLQKKQKLQMEEGLKSMKVITDLLVSLSVGFSGTLFLLEAKREDMRIDYEEAPLIAGRSLIADEMCPGMLKLHRSNPSIRLVLEDTTWKKEQRKWEQLDLSLVTFETFIQNCKKRSDYESKIRKEQRKSENFPVLIPHTGLR
mmetsp:Transcript_49338/g.55139  ORF Transcript_49338/g.55139 Transcript_49338/m.55139 type:complete len:281 (-) Transcript_49338:21-863(-)